MHHCCDESLGTFVLNPEIRPPNAWAKYPEPIDASNVCSVSIAWMTGLDCLWRTSDARLRGLWAMENTRESADNRLAAFSGQRIPLVGLWRTLFFMPFVVSLVVVALIWKVILIDKVGFINRMFELVGLQGRSWLGDPNLSRTTAGQMRVADRHRERGALAGKRGSRN